MREIAVYAARMSLGGAALGALIGFVALWLIWLSRGRAGVSHTGATYQVLVI